MTGGDSYLCPVCGYDALDEPPWTNDAPSDEICPSCGTHFGYDDVAGGDAAARIGVHHRLRDRWVRAGCPWFSATRPAPVGWDAKVQLNVLEEG